MISNSRGLRKRHKREGRFKAYGLISIFIAVSVLILMLGGVLKYSYKAFYRAEARAELYFEKDKAYSEILEAAFNLEELKLISSSAEMVLHHYIQNHPESWGKKVKVWLPLSEDIERYLKGYKNIKPYKIEILHKWLSQDLANLNFNKRFFSSGDSREPELAGIWGAIIGTVYTLFITFLIAFPLGIASAVYLEEFAKKNKITELIEININNLASVPSIIFGLLGLILFINYFNLPRSSPLVGGMTLSLITFPIIVIATRAALQTVPKFIREAARGLGASDVQVTFHHVIPLAMPGILTGAILGMSRALGESAPLLMVGMAAFIVDIPQSPLDPATTLPVQIFTWIRNPEQGFMENAAAAILVLLVFLIMMNGVALILRRKFEVKWQ